MKQAVKLICWRNLKECVCSVTMPLFPPPNKKKTKKQKTTTCSDGSETWFVEGFVEGIWRNVCVQWRRPLFPPKNKQKTSTKNLFLLVSSFWWKVKTFIFSLSVFHPWLSPQKNITLPPLAPPPIWKSGGTTPFMW